MKLHFQLCFLVSFILLFTGVQAQTENQPIQTNLGRAQSFYFDALNFGQYDQFGISSRLDLFVQIPFDLLTFVKKDEIYNTSYTITVLFSDEDGDRLKEESWTRKVERTSFEGTIDPNMFDLTQKSFELESGSVLMEILFEAGESTKEYRQTKKIIIRKFDKNLFAMSDIMFVNHVENKGGKKHISPQIDPNVAGYANGFYLFFEIYNPLEIPEILIKYKITKRNQPVLEKTEIQNVVNGPNSFLTNINTSSLPVGAFTVDVYVHRSDDSSQTGIIAHGKKQFILEWLSGKTPVAITDLEQAIEQLRYFAKSDDIDHIKATTDENERLKRFEDFWERNNPTPGSSPNKLMVEYYKRVAYANEHFRHFIDGWKTDRGMVYIIYGPPSYVDRHPIDVESKPYEVWEYYDINRRFIFIDESGFGDYRLYYPIWDERNRIR